MTKMRGRPERGGLFLLELGCRRGKQIPDQVRDDGNEGPFFGAALFFWGLKALPPIPEAEFQSSKR
jgi:hypothetical protein